MPSISPRSLRSPPAAEYKVGNQSEMCISWFETLAAFCNLGDHKAATPLTPPSYNVYLVCNKVQQTVCKNESYRNSRTCLRETVKLIYSKVKDIFIFMLRIGQITWWLNLNVRSGVDERKSILLQYYLQSILIISLCISFESWFRLEIGDLTLLLLNIKYFFSIPCTNPFMLKSNFSNISCF